MRTVALISVSLFVLLGFMGKAYGCGSPPCVAESLPPAAVPPPMVIMTPSTVSDIWFNPSLAPVSAIAQNGIGGIASSSAARSVAGAGEPAGTLGGLAEGGAASNAPTDGQATNGKVTGSVVTSEDGIPTLSGLDSSAGQKIIDNINLKEAGWTGSQAKAGMLASDNPAAVIGAVRTAGNIMVAIEQNFLLPRLNMGKSASIQSWKELGVLLASNNPKDAQVALKNMLKTKKVNWVSLDSKSSEFILSVWLTCYALLSPEGSRFLPWAVARSIHKSNVFYEAILHEMERTLTDRKLSHRKERIRLLKAVLYNPDVLFIRNWLAKIGPMVVIEKENTAMEEEKKTSEEAEKPTDG